MQLTYFPQIFDNVIWDLRSLSRCRKTFLPKTVLLQKQQLGMSGKACRRLGCNDCSCCSARSTKLQNSSVSSLKLGWKIRLLNTNCSPHAISLAEHDALRRGGKKWGAVIKFSDFHFFLFCKLKFIQKPRLDFRLFCSAVYASEPRRSAVSRSFTFQSL